ncbi:MAG: ParB-like nuclease domain-containing protein [Firmicutes bacterium]|nr:ParB-like nuclease domain-containing protein [Bacillota bacterium]
MDFDFKSVFEGKTIAEKCRLHTQILEKLVEASGIPHAVACVKWVHISEVQANDYNPNKVARTEMQLLYTSIKHDSYTQPVVVAWDDEEKKYIVIDGFHRYSIIKLCPDIAVLTDGYLPVVVLKKTLAERMAATVRHNRARGTHSVQGMSNMIYKMLYEGRSDAEICNELGLEAEELVRLKHITGYAKLYKNVVYNRAWAFNTPMVEEKDIKSEAVKDIVKDGGFEQEE